MSILHILFFLHGVLSYSTFFFFLINIGAMFETLFSKELREEHGMKGTFFIPQADGGMNCELTAQRPEYHWTLQKKDSPSVVVPSEDKDFKAEYDKQIVEEGRDCLTLEACEYRVKEADLKYGKCFVLDKPTKISGQGRGLTTLVGFGLLIKGNKSDGIVEINNLKIKGGRGYGLKADGGMNVIMRGCSVEECQDNGVEAYEVDISCDDLQVVGCGQSGVYVVSSAQGTTTITLSGQGTTIQRNGTKGRILDYGLKAANNSCKIYLVAPLTKEQISTNNSGGGNWNEGGKRIKQVSK